MQKLKKYFDYEFINELRYIKNGEEVQAEKITVKAPTNKNRKDIIILEQEFEKSQMKMATMLANTEFVNSDFFKEAVNLKEEHKKFIKEQKENSEENKEIENPQEIIKHLYAGDADMNKCFNALKNILLSSNNYPIAMIDDTQKVTETIFDDISFSDIKNILGLYIINFFIASQAF